MEEDSMWVCVVEYRLHPDSKTRFTEKFLSRNPVGSIEVAMQKAKKIARIPIGMHAEIIGWSNEVVQIA